MSDALPERPNGGRGAALVLATYTAAVFLSALLLFGVQPMFTRMVLPQLGGSPSVWSVAMVFFQSMLLAGYAYAHWLSAARHRLVPVVVHLALLGAAGLTLPLSIAQGWGAPPATGTAFWLLGLFSVSIGLPFFALAANNPLLQTWFVRTGHYDAKDPYFLYAASNVGSFLALLSYPVLLEPLFTLQVQDRLWTGGYGLLVAVIAACAILLLRAPSAAAKAIDEDAVAAKPSWLTIGRWVFVSAVPSGLLIAVTAHISTDVAAAPLLWIMPLSLYLLTWVLVFARRPIFTQAFMLLMQPFAIAAVVPLLLYSGRGSLLTSLAAHLLTFFVIAMACHGEVARCRPAPAHLTAFYVSLSFGGMVGGLFAGLLTPNIFSWVAEYPILVVLAVLCRPAADSHWVKFDRWFWTCAGLVTVALIVPATLGLHATDKTATLLYVAILSLATVSIALALLRHPLKSAVAVALALALIRLYSTNEGRSETLRNFFGVNEVFETADRRFRVLKHGSTIHGAQMLLTKDGRAVTGRPEPLTYYHRNSGMAAVIEAVRARKGSPMRVAAVGLGTGSLACYIAPGETWRYFEIDPTVIAIARDPARFNFLSACAPNLDIVLGDARLTLAHEPDGAYDLIVIDAYSSDAIPVHLATREAMAIYKAKLAPHGVVTMHITNRHLELRSVVAGIAASNGLKTWAWSNPDDRTDPENFIARADVVIAAERPDDIGALAQAKNWTPVEPDPSVRTWTDDYSNIAGALLRRYIQPAPDQH
jgi:spermidine synthase